MNLEIRHISFEEILPVWSQHLWPGRTSAIEPFSMIEYNSMPYRYNSLYSASNCTFFALYLDQDLVGVNSGHGTGDSYRSRGLYVFDRFRGNNYGGILLAETIKFARLAKFEYIWSIPRQTSFKTYANAGFIKTSDWFSTETSMQNAYVSVDLT